MPCEAHPVNHLVTALDAAVSNSPTPTRELLEVGRLLVLCQSCDEWDIDRGCQRMSRQAWVGLMITPGRECNRRPTVARPADPRALPRF